MTQTQWAPTETPIATHSLYASFADASLAEKAAGALLDYGVRSEDISLVSKNRRQEEWSDMQDNPRHEDRHDDARDNTELAAKKGLSTTTPGDAAAGAAKGAGIGLGVGIAAALASIFIPGFGLVAGGGALAMAIGGAAATTAAGAVAGGVTGYLKDQGVPDEPAMRYNETYEAGGAILAVNVPSNGVDEATIESLLTKYQANHIGTYSYRAL